MVFDLVSFSTGVILKFSTVGGKKGNGTDAAGAFGGLGGLFGGRGSIWWSGRLTRRSYRRLEIRNSFMTRVRDSHLHCCTWMSKFYYSLEM